MNLPAWLRAALAGTGERRDGESTLRRPSSALREALLGGEAAGTSVTPTTAFRHGAVYACLRVLTDAVGSVPLHVYDRGDGSSRRRADFSEAARILNRPSPYLTQSALMATTMAHLAGWGDAFIAKYRSPGGRIVQLGTIHPARVGVRISAGEPIFTVAPDHDGTGARGEYNRRDILHVKALSIDGIRGMSAIQQARATIGVGIALAEHAAEFFQNGSHPSGVIEVAGELSDGAATRLREQWESLHRGRGRRHRVAVLEQGTKWSPVGLPMEDMQFIEQRKLSATEIAAVFRVPPHMIGAESGSSLTYQNREQAAIEFVTYSLRPWLVCIEQAMAADEDLFAAGGSLYPEFLVDALLRSDTLSRFQAYTIALGGAPFMAQNEVRGRENLPSVDGGDQLPQTPAAAAAPAAVTEGA